MWGLKATVRGTLRVLGRQKSPKQGRTQPASCTENCAAGWSMGERIRMEGRVAVHGEGRGAG